MYTLDVLMCFPFYGTSLMEVIFGWCLTRCLFILLQGEDRLCWGYSKYQDELGIPKEISKPERAGSHPAGGLRQTVENLPMKSPALRRPQTMSCKETASAKREIGCL